MKLFGTFFLAYLTSHLFSHPRGFITADHPASLLLDSGQFSRPAQTLRESKEPRVSVKKAHLMNLARSSTGKLIRSEGRFPCASSAAASIPAATDAEQTVFQVWVNAQVVAELPTQPEADAIATQIKGVLQDPSFDPKGLKPVLVEGVPTGIAGATVLFMINEAWANQFGQNAELMAIAWVNNLRVALQEKPLSLADAQTHLYGLAQTRNRLTGIASWYGPYFHGRLTAAGERFNQHDLTAAHPSLPFGTYLKVTNLESGRSVLVRINDRGPYVGIRSLDLSREAARCLGSEQAGVVPYEAVIMQENPSASAYAVTKPNAERLAKR